MPRRRSLLDASDADASSSEVVISHPFETQSSRRSILEASDDARSSDDEDQSGHGTLVPVPPPSTATASSSAPTAPSVAVAVTASHALVPAPRIRQDRNHERLVSLRGGCRPRIGMSRDEICRRARQIKFESALTDLRAQVILDYP